ncbi:MAG: type II toxin-antitoxin system Phd/YefM family antitoxin [Burkholderiaceae bacterium]
MQRMTATQAKQNFGELMDALAQGPIVIERHGKVRAIVCAPDAFDRQAARMDGLAERRAARAAQQSIDKDRLIKHQKIAIELLLMPAAQRRAAIAKARAEVDKWRRERLCSPDYADRWQALLDLPATELARAMSDESLDWGRALRQNSPWHVART